MAPSPPASSQIPVSPPFSYYCQTPIIVSSSPVGSLSTTSHSQVDVEMVDDIPLGEPMDVDDESNVTMQDAVTDDSPCFSHHLILPSPTGIRRRLGICTSLPFPLIARPCAPLPAQEPQLIQFPKPYLPFPHLLTVYDEADIPSASLRRAPDDLPTPHLVNAPTSLTKIHCVQQGAVPSDTLAERAKHQRCGGVYDQRCLEQTLEVAADLKDSCAVVKQEGSRLMRSFPRYVRPRGSRCPEPKKHSLIPGWKGRREFDSTLVSRVVSFDQGDRRTKKLKSAATLVPVVVGASAAILAGITLAVVKTSFKATGFLMSAIWNSAKSVAPNPSPAIALVSFDENSELFGGDDDEEVEHCSGDPSATPVLILRSTDPQ
ncbi:hypothetical protein DXG01_004949 [Tephrocybe rancida]|nr:hypothetical protein DXG01_004949 [Tephrocybe rancida]